MSSERPGEGPAQQGRFSPIVARTRTLQRPVGPIAQDCVNISFVRSGTAELFGGIRRTSIAFGDAVLIGPGVLCGVEPEGAFTATTALLDTDYAVDQAFWQYADLMSSRHDALGFAAVLYAEPLQVLRLGEDRAGLLLPWLDELVALSVSGSFLDRFNRMQSLWFAIADVLGPYVAITPARTSRTQCERAWPTAPRHRRFRVLRDEARQAAEFMREDLARRWTLDELAELVHLSTSQLGRVFANAFGKSPITYLTIMRAERMATLLRTSDAPISRIAVEVGWPDPDFATRQFRRNVGMTPTQFRAMETGRAVLPDPDYLGN